MITTNKSHWFSVALISILVIVYLGLIYCTWNVCRASYTLPVRHLEYDSIFADTDSQHLERLRSIDSMSGYDSVMAAILAEQKIILKRQDDLINDIRQETNNNIDKTNALISFWVGIMALFGVFIPIVLQFRLNHDSKAESKRQMEDFKNSCRLELDELKNEIENRRQNIERLRYINELNALCLGADHRMFSEVGERTDIERALWAYSTDALANWIETVFSEDSKDNEETRFQLIECMIHILATFNMLRGYGSSRHRDIMQTENSVRKLIAMITEQKYPNWKSLGETMRDLVRELREMDLTR